MYIGLRSLFPINFLREGNTEFKTVQKYICMVEPLTTQYGCFWTKTLESTSYKKQALKTTPLIKEFRSVEESEKARTEYYKLKSCSLYSCYLRIRFVFCFCRPVKWVVGKRGCVAMVTQPIELLAAPPHCELSLQPQGELSATSAFITTIFFVNAIFPSCFLF